MKKKLILWIGILGLIISPICAAPLQIIATIPDLGWAAKQIGGDEVVVNSLLTGIENPHFIDAIPNYVWMAAKADMVVFAGLGLEEGWLPKVLEQSSNPNVQPGGIGYCPVGNYVTVLQKPTIAVNRSMGDLHPWGNPHFYLSPKRLAEGAEGIAEMLAGLRPEKADYFFENLAQFQDDMNTLLEVQKERIVNAINDQKKPLMMEYHREFLYFATDYEIPYFGAMEEKPGVPPSAGYLARRAIQAKKENVTVILESPYYPKSVFKRFSQLSDVPVVNVPSMIGEKSRAKTYEEEQIQVIDAILGPL